MSRTSGSFIRFHYLIGHSYTYTPRVFTRNNSEHFFIYLCIIESRIAKPPQMMRHGNEFMQEISEYLLIYPLTRTSRTANTPFSCIKFKSMGRLVPIKVFSIFARKMLTTEHYKFPIISVDCCALNYFPLNTKKTNE